MSYKKLIIPIVMMCLLIPITNTIAFTYIDNFENGDYIFFLTDLNATENLELTLNRDGGGNFTLFIFNTRPLGSNLNGDNSLKASIFNNPPTVALSLDDYPHINYTAIAKKIYYIEIILVSGGPDTFTLTANKDLTRYYLPLIPGFHIEVLLISFILTIGLMIFIYNKKKKK